MAFLASLAVHPPQVRTRSHRSDARCLRSEAQANRSKPLWRGTSSLEAVSVRRAPGKKYASISGTTLRNVPKLWPSWLYLAATRTPAAQHALEQLRIRMDVSLVCAGADPDLEPPIETLPAVEVGLVIVRRRDQRRRQQRQVRDQARGGPARPATRRGRPPSCPGAGAHPDAAGWGSVRPRTRPRAPGRPGSAG